MQANQNRYFIINKPFNMVSQFISPHKVRLLGDLDYDFPPGTHAIGRLDNHSEGLLVLTTNKKLTRLLFLSDVPHKRTYLVQVSNKVAAENITRLREGVSIRIKTGISYITPPAEVNIVSAPEDFFEPGERLTAFPPFTWLSITITEGKYHQVRKMIGAIKHKCKRLVRVSIEDLKIDRLRSGEVMEVGESYIFEKLKLGDKKITAN